MKVVSANMAITFFEMLKSDAELTLGFLEIDKKHGTREVTDIEFVRAKSLIKSIEMKIESLKRSEFSAQEIA